MRLSFQVDTTLLSAELKQQVKRNVCSKWQSSRVKFNRHRLFRTTIGARATRTSKALFNMSSSTYAFVSVFACSFTPPTKRLCSARRQNLFSARIPRDNRPRWYAVSGTPPPSPPSNDDSSSGNPIDGDGDIFSSGSSASGESSPSPEDRSDDGSRDSEFNLDLTTTKSTEDENELFNMIKAVPPPELVKQFTESAPPVVQKAIRETLVSILGSLPPLAFYTTVSSMTANLIQLFHSTLITGYMFRNAAYRMELTRTLDWSGLNATYDPNKALPTSEGSTDQPEIKGGVAIFKQPDGTTVEVPVDQYIGELRETVTNLRDELVRERKGGNELLSFISTMDKDNMESLTKNAGSEVVEAMKKVVDFVTTSQGIDKNQNAVIEASAPELGQLLFYLMVSGFFLREAEVRRDLQKRIGGESTLNNLLESSEPGDVGPPDPETPPSSEPPTSPKT